MLLLGHHIENKKSFIRGAIIPYTKKQDEIYVLMAIDRKTRELSDFGGGIKKNESVFDGTLRELKEESCNILNNSISKEHLRHSYVITNNMYTQCIFFVEIDPTWLYFISSLFQTQLTKYTSKKYRENIGVSWLHINIFNSYLKNDTYTKLWPKLRSFINKHGTESIIDVFTKNIHHVI